ncbi:unnamed protein product [Enterobius vermicularis]|uniref:LRRcap domain-containing protein n=1 Tax=Enterobius vermicularis TaxID=51028 RepID=A0A0N4VMR5_ENTVE|nr:unnamed protein product [Enterobius vermicularis]
MEDRIQLERRGLEPNEVEHLNLDNIKAKRITGLSDEYKALKTLSMINVGLTSLEGLPNLPALKHLDLSDNKISKDLERLENCPSLTHLNLAGNNIIEIESLRPLASLRNLVSLDLFNCEVANVEKYRESVFKMLPALKWLDGYDKNDVDEEELTDDNNSYSGGGENEEDEEEDDAKPGLAYLDSSEVLQVQLLLLSI